MGQNKKWIPLKMPVIVNFSILYESYDLSEKVRQRKDNFHPEAKSKNNLKI